MADFQHITAGQPLDGLSAGDWNATMDMMRQLQGNSRKATAPFRQPSTASTTTITIKNTSGEDLYFGSVVSIDGVAISPQDNEADFLFNTVFTAIKPRIKDEYGQLDSRIAITTEPIEENGCGQAIVGGYAVCKVGDSQPWHKYADVIVDETSNLGDCPGGHCRIHYRNSSTGWGVVELGVNPYVRYYGKLTTSFNGVGTIKLLTFSGTEWEESNYSTTVYAPPIFTGTISSGKKISCHWEPLAQRLELDGKEC